MTTCSGIRRAPDRPRDLHVRSIEGPPAALRQCRRVAGTTAMPGRTRDPATDRRRRHHEEAHRVARGRQPRRPRARRDRRGRRPAAPAPSRARRPQAPGQRTAQSQAPGGARVARPAGTSSRRSSGSRPAEVRTHRQSGCRSPRSPRSKSVDPQKLVDALVAQWTTRIDYRVSTGALTTPEASARSRARSRSARRTWSTRPRSAACRAPPSAPDRAMAMGRGAGRGRDAGAGSRVRRHRDHGRWTLRRHAALTDARIERRPDRSTRPGRRLILVRWHASSSWTTSRTSSTWSARTWCARATSSRPPRR